MYIWCIGSSKSAVACIADARQSTILHEVRNVSLVTDMYLVISIRNCSIEIRWTLQLNNTYRNTIDEEHYIRSSCLLSCIVRHNKLVYSTKDIVLFWVFACKIKIINPNCLGRIMTLELETISIKCKTYERSSENSRSYGC